MSKRNIFCDEDLEIEDKTRNGDKKKENPKKKSPERKREEEYIYQRIQYLVDNFEKNVRNEDMLN